MKSVADLTDLMTDFESSLFISSEPKSTYLKSSKSFPNLGQNVSKHVLTSLMAFGPNLVPDL